ncbi:MAG: minor capsid protein [Faecalibacterium sp.]
METTRNIIRAPAGKLIEARQGGAIVRVQVRWDGSFAARANTGWIRAQRKFGMEVARRMEPYVPFDTGMLKSSVVSASDFDSGELVYNTPYARRQYYLHPRGQGIHDGRRGSWWGQRCIADHKRHFVNFGRACIGEVFKR